MQVGNTVINFISVFQPMLLQFTNNKIAIVDNKTFQTLAQPKVHIISCIARFRTGLHSTKRLSMMLMSSPQTRHEQKQDVCLGTCLPFGPVTLSFWLIPSGLICSLLILISLNPQSRVLIWLQPQPNTPLFFFFL